MSKTYLKYQMAGLCRCGKRVPAIDRTRCEICLNKATAATLANRINNLKSGYCRCGRITSSGYRCCSVCNIKSVSRKRRKMDQLRTEVFAAYGGSCNCCNLRTPEFLTIDHINGGGRKHQADIGSGIDFYRWLTKSRFPMGFQILCWNCNCAKGQHKNCPHREQRQYTTAQSRHRLKLRLMVFDAYGGKCSCCAMNEEPFLTLDHVHGDGSKHRSKIKQTSSLSMYRWARDNNFPPSLQILCWNCNVGKQLYGICPHQKSLAEC